VGRSVRYSPGGREPIEGTLQSAISGFQRPDNNERYPAVYTAERNGAPVPPPTCSPPDYAGLRREAEQEARLGAPSERVRVPHHAVSSRRVAAFAALVALFPCVAGAAPVRAERHARAYHVKTIVSLAAYDDVHAAALGPSGAIAGDADRDGNRRCLLATGGTLTDITPPGWNECEVAAMSADGTVAGRVGGGEKTEGFIYRAGRAYVFGDVRAFLAVNSAALLIAVKPDGTRGIYDAADGTWPRFANAGAGCALDQPIALNEHYVFGSATCAAGGEKYALADASHYLSVTLPPGLAPTSILTSADQLVLADAASGGHAYLWSVRGGRAPLDLGEATDDLYGTYTPVAANAQGVVVGENYPEFFVWIRSRADGVRDLGSLIVPPNYFGLSVADVNEAGDVLVQAFDFGSGGQSWMVLQAG